LTLLSTGLNLGGAALAGGEDEQTGQRRSFADVEGPMGDVVDPVRGLAENRIGANLALQAILGGGGFQPSNQMGAATQLRGRNPAPRPGPNWDKLMSFLLQQPGQPGAPPAQAQPRPGAGSVRRRSL
jgi:hypothetical protein